MRLSLARLCALDGRLDEATDWFAAARAVFTEQGARPLLAIADHDEAWMHIRHPGHAPVSAVESLLERAAEACADIGMSGWLTRSCALQQQLGVGAHR